MQSQPSSLYVSLEQLMLLFVPVGFIQFILQLYFMCSLFSQNCHNSCLFRVPSTHQPPFLHSSIIIIIISFIVSTKSINFADISSQNNHDTMGTSKANISLFKLVPNCSLLTLRQRFLGNKSCLFSGSLNEVGWHRHRTLL